MNNNQEKDRETEYKIAPAFFDNIVSQNNENQQFCLKAAILNKCKIFKQRPILIIWLLVYFLISWATQGFTPKGLLTTAVIYLITTTVALSDFIETILKHIEDVRNIATNTEKEKLIPLFEEVYEKVQKQTPDISKNINLYIVDEISVNAFALGTNTIAITRGLMEFMDDDEIKGILAHEMGHMAKGDPKVQTLITIGSSMYLWVLLIIKWTLGKMEQVASSSESQTSLGNTVLGIMKWIVDFAVKIITLIATILLMIENREKEYQADSYAEKLGYGYELKQALYKLYTLQMSDKRNLIERFKASHPRIAYRIERLEGMEMEME
ncbi:M48 family metalloprotease [Acetivibrio cellulolyticus]|uniref:M48 family metalloprotease n=1 Tax=Acetivibrio cellulolyticus TaxID=35830 RepID=UPI0001E2BA5F|nr:M48 family metalloprotease [Acetivibrio cellulolyticus]